MDLCTVVDLAKLAVFPRILFLVWFQVRAGTGEIFLRWGRQKGCSHNSLQIVVGFQEGPLSSCWSNGLSCWHGAAPGPPVPSTPTQSPPSDSLSCKLAVCAVPWRRCQLLQVPCVAQFGGNERQPWVPACAHWFQCFPRFQFALLPPLSWVPSWLSEPLDFRSPPDTEATACHRVHQLPQLFRV